jgi:hypothetical protein
MYQFCDIHIESNNWGRLKQKGISETEEDIKSTP